MKKGEATAQVTGVEAERLTFSKQHFKKEGDVQSYLDEHGYREMEIKEERGQFVALGIDVAEFKKGTIEEFPGEEDGVSVFAGELKKDGAEGATKPGKPTMAETSTKPVASPVNKKDKGKEKDKPGTAKPAPTAKKKAAYKTPAAIKKEVGDADISDDGEEDDDVSEEDEDERPAEGEADDESGDDDTDDDSDDADDEEEGDEEDDSEDDDDTEEEDDSDDSEEDGDEEEADDDSEEDDSDDDSDDDEDADGEGEEDDEEDGEESDDEEDDEPAEGRKPTAKGAKKTASEDDEEEAKPTPKQKTAPAFKGRKGRPAKRHALVRKGAVRTVLKKMDYYGTTQSRDVTVAEVIEDGCEDGMPPGIDDVLFATRIAIRNAFGLNGQERNDALDGIGGELATLVKRLAAVFDNATKADKKSPLKKWAENLVADDDTVIANMKKLLVAKGDTNATKDDPQGIRSAVEKAIADALADETTGIGQVKATVDAVKANLLKSTSALESRLVKIESQRQRKQALTTADDEDEGEGDEDDERSSTKKDDEDEDAEFEELMKFNATGIRTPRSHKKTR